MDRGRGLVPGKWTASRFVDTNPILDGATRPFTKTALVRKKCSYLNLV